MGILDRFKKEEKEAVPAPAPMQAMKQNRQHRQPVILGPVVTEKATKTGVYYFHVVPAATKNEVRKAIHQLYGKKPRKVNMLNVKGKATRFGRTVGKRSDWKRAVVYLAPGETIDVFTK